jgi:5-methylcytosine-specific restriction endonuclease McrA
MTKEETRRDLLLLSTYKRSDGWPRARKLYLLIYPECAVCGERKKVVVHHILPFYLFPSLELEPTNFMTLCEEHHLLFGHLNDFKSYNEEAICDAQIWERRIKNRPKWKQIA